MQAESALGVADGPVTVPATPMVQVTGVFKIYKEGGAETVALQGADLELSNGEFVSMTGASGSGKSSLLWIIAGLALPSAGQVMFDGRDLTRLDETARAEVRARHIGIVFQRGNLVPFLSAEENLALASRIAGGKHPNRCARELLGEVGLGSRLRHYPRQLSGGEAQRVGVALALVNQPRLLLGDEITGELDSATSAAVMGLLLRLQRELGMTVLVVTHNPGVAAMADRSLNIADGQVRPS
ncbi:MAG: ABC transporter ATP-binding protein [Candidatus Dormibacteraeota bacterium]|nr:ABC transporter ATP-binding protein [Candidatus Dormibacteraeota bacterium]